MIEITITIKESTLNCSTSQSIEITDLNNDAINRAIVWLTKLRK